MLRTALILSLLALSSCKRTSPYVFVDPALATLVPPDTTMLAGVRLEALKKTAFYERYATDGRLKAMEEFRRATGIDPAKDLWELLAASDGKSMVVLIRGKFSEHGLEPKLDRPGALRFSYKGYTLIGDERGAVVFLNPTTAAAGPTSALRQLVDRRNEATGIRRPLQERIGKIPAANHAWLVADVSGRLPEKVGDAPPMVAAMVRLLKTVQFAQATLDVRQTFRLKVDLDCADEREGERLAGAVRALLGLGRLNTPDLDNEGTRAYDKMQIYRERNVVHFSTDLTFEELEKSALSLPLLGVK